jgi:nucleotide-binding universal stress UspA family protein
MYKTILVPLDGSKRAEAILPHAEELALQSQARLVLLEVVEPPYGAMETAGMAPVLDESLYQALLSEAEAYLADVQEALRKKGIEAKTRVVVGPIVGQIMDTARQEQADVIAMASHGRTGLKRVFYGSVAAGVLHIVDRPLFLVRSIDG